MGTVYLSEYNGKDTVTKIERYNGDNTTKSNYIRQQEFNDKVAVKHPDIFMTLKFSGIDKECKHVQKVSEHRIDWPKKIRDYHDRKAKFPYCSVMVYEPVLKYTLGEVNNKLNTNNKVRIFKYLKDSVKIMNDAGYLHRDIHDGNIMCDITMKKWYIIDYGAIWRKGYIKNIDDDRMGYGSDLLFMWFFIENPIFNYIEKNKIRKPLYSKFQRTMKKDPRYKVIEKLIPKGQPKNSDWDALICCIMFYDLYIKCIEADDLPIGKKYMEFKQPNEKYFMSVIRSI
jgi:serine/threonine protein kinase